MRKTLHNGTRVTAALSGSPAISGATLTLTLAEAVLYSERNVTVSYARPPRAAPTGSWTPPATRRGASPTKR